jgi:hypothetical protein
MDDFASPILVVIMGLEIRFFRLGLLDDLRSRLFPRMRRRAGQNEYGQQHR